MIGRYIVLPQALSGVRQCLMEYMHGRLATGSIALHVVEQQARRRLLGGG